MGGRRCHTEGPVEESGGLLGGGENLVAGIMRVGGEAGPGSEGPHVPCDGIFALF